MYRGALGRFLAASGQIRLDRRHPDPAAVKSCLRVLETGGAVGVFPRGRGGPVTSPPSATERPTSPWSAGLPWCRS